MLISWYAGIWIKSIVEKISYRDILVIIMSNIYKSFIILKLLYTPPILISTFTITLLIRHCPCCSDSKSKIHWEEQYCHLGKYSTEISFILLNTCGSVQSLSRASLRPHESQHARPPCPSPTPVVHSNSRPSSWWSHHLILCSPFFLLPPIPPSIRVFSNESTLRMRWPKYWSFSFSIIPSKEHPGLISFRMDWLDLLAVQGISRVFSNTTVQKHQFFGAQPSSQCSSHIHTWPQEKP